MTDELDIYRRQGFAQSIGIGEAPALVIVDFVVGFTDPAHFGGGNIQDAIVQTRPLLALARARGWPVVHTRVVYADDGSDCGGFTRKVPALRGLTEASPLSQIVPELTPRAGELVLRKHNASAFFGTELAGWLAARRVDTLLVSGCTTSGCVRATVIELVQPQLPHHRRRRLRRRPCAGAARGQSFRHAAEIRGPDDAGRDRGGNEPE